MTDLRDQIATIVWLHKDYSEGYDAADAIMELVQARTDELGSILTNIVRDDIHHETFSEDITGAEVAALANTLRAALKGTDT